MERKYGFPRALSRLRAVRLSKLASRTVRAKYHLAAVANQLMSNECPIYAYGQSRAAVAASTRFRREYSVFENWCGHLKTLRLPFHGGESGSIPLGSAIYPR